jgi:pre-60S factor REI1
MSSFASSSSSDAGAAICNTCRAAFSGIEKVKEHYRSEWHILNSKRRASNLMPLTKAEFKALGIAAPPKKSAAPAPAPAAPVAAPAAPARVLKKSAAAMPAAVEGEGDEEGEGDADEGEEGEEEEEGAEVEVLPVAPTISIFDTKEFATVDECVEYMATAFGFFIPDVEYLVDLEGFLQYLGEKVKLGGFCLYCQRQMKPGRPCQNHMRSKSHCKVAFEEGVDMEEFEDFYDYTASYDGALEDEDGNVRQVEISPLGELVLLDGRVAGHRDYRIYYQQRFRPEETRPSVLAQQREELERLGIKYGATMGGARISREDMHNMTDTQVMSMLVKFHKEVRRGQIIEQRATQRKAMLDQKKEYQSNVDKLRSSATTTAKIRDYHRIL